MASPPRDYYTILGVPRDASPEDVKKAFRALAMRYHPDRRPDDLDAERRFKEILEAYDVLSDPEKRRQYDQFGPFFSPAGRPATPEDLNEFLKNTLGGIFRWRSDRKPGGDLVATVHVSLEDVATGAERSVGFARKVRCARCDGQGADPDGGSRTCTDCGGTGKARGRLLRTECPRCDGQGKITVKRCERCGGEGRHGSEEQVKVKVPPGVGPGQKLKLAGKGDQPAGPGRTGDLIVIVQVDEHPIFRRRGMDLVCDLPLTFPEAALGDVVTVPTLSGETRIRIPPGTPPGKVFRVAGEGLPGLRGHLRGDLHFKVEIVVPEQMDVVQRSTIEALARAVPPSSYARRRSFDEILKRRPRSDVPPKTPGTSR
jgi:molecular chaperone DnaJ